MTKSDDTKCFQNPALNPNDLFVRGSQESLRILLTKLKLNSFRLICLRQNRKERRAPKIHNADDEFEELVEGKRTYSVEEKLASEKFGPGFVKEMEGKDFTLAHVQERGFSEPLLFKSKEGLHIKVPSPDFSVKDIRFCVGESSFFQSA
jgi:hypothetical protein